MMEFAYFDLVFSVSVHVMSFKDKGLAHKKRLSCNIASHLVQAAETDRK